MRVHGLVGTTHSPFEGMSTGKHLNNSTPKQLNNSTTQQSNPSFARFFDDANDDVMKKR